MIGYKTKIYVEIKNVVSWHDMVVSRHDTIISCYERVHYITMQTLVIRLQQHNNTTTSYSCVKSKNSPPYLRKRSWYGYSVLLFFCCSLYVNRTNWESTISFYIVSLYNDFTSFIVSFKIQTFSQ